MSMKSSSNSSLADDDDDQNIALSRAKWQKMMSKGLQHFLHDHKETFLRRVRRGIPAEYRWNVWQAAVGEDDYILNNGKDRGENRGGENDRDSKSKKSKKKSEIKMIDNSEANQVLQSESRKAFYLNLTTKDNKWISLIKIDISRTFPETSEFDDGHQAKLLRILSAYSNFNLDVGYCQGINFVAGLLLLVSNSNEVETFWIFLALMENRGLKGFYKDRFPLLKQYLRAFDLLLDQQLPELRAHFKSENVQPAVYLHQWFLTLYINCLPLQTVLVIWDVLLCEGLHVLLTITLSLLKVLQTVLLKLEFEDIVKFFRTMKTGDEDCDATMIGQLLIRQSARVELGPQVMQLISSEDGFGDGFGEEDDGFLADHLIAANKIAESENNLTWFERMGADIAYFFQDQPVAEGQPIPGMMPGQQPGSCGTSIATSSAAPVHLDHQDQQSVGQRGSTSGTGQRGPSQKNGNTPATGSSGIKNSSQNARDQGNSSRLANSRFQNPPDGVPKPSSANGNGATAEARRKKKDGTFMYYNEQDSPSPIDEEPTDIIYS